MAAEAHQHCKRNQEFERRAEPQPIADLGPVLAERDSQQARRGCEQRRLPEMVRQATNHFDVRVLPAFCCRSSRDSFYSSAKVHVCYPAMKQQCRNVENSEQISPAKCPIKTCKC